MKNFKEFSAEWELADTFKDWKIGDCMFALYAAYQQGYNEGMKENLNNMLSAFIDDMEKELENAETEEN